MPTKSVTRHVRTDGPFAEQYRSAVLELRAAFTKLLLSVGANPTKPQDVARRFSLNKNLTWMISKIVNTPDVYSVAPHIPGPARIERVLTAMKKGGAPGSAIDDVRRAIRSFDQLVDTHTGDRATLEMMIAGLSREDVKAEQLAQCRKLAFKGLSGILGAQARLRLSCYILAPNAQNPAMVDLVEVKGMLGFRRLRTDARWLLFRRQRWSGDASARVGVGEVPLDTDYPDADELPLLSTFCSSPIPSLDVIRDGDEVHHELPPGPVGNTAALDIIFGVLERQAGPAYRDAQERFCELGSSLTTPAQTLLFDVLLHEDLPWSTNPELILCSLMDGDAAHLVLNRSRNRLPFTEEVQHLGRGVTRMITPHMPNYPDLVRWVFDRVEWNAGAFHALRFIMEYPPIPAMPVFRWELPEPR